MRPNGHKPILLLAIFVIMAVEFVADIVSPLGISDWTCYFIPLLLTAYAGSRFFPYLLAGLLSLLMLAGYYFSPPGLNAQYALTARLIGIAVLWVMALLISRRKEMEETLIRTERALKAISDCKQALVRASTEPALLQEICRLIVGQGGYKLAWVGFPENDERKSVSIAAHAGHDEGYLAQLNLTWANSEMGGGPTGQAIRSGQTVVCHDIQADPMTTTWRAEAAKRGFCGLIVLPLLAEKKVFGILCLYADVVNWFKTDEVNLLKGLADDLAYGLQSLRRRIEHQQTEERLRQLSRAVEQCPVSVVITDTAGRIDYVNPKFVEVSGYTFDEVRGKSPRLLKAGSQPEEFYRRLWQTITAGHEWRGEFLNRKKNGETFWESASISPIKDTGGRITGYVAVKDDITRDKFVEEKVREQAEMLNLAHDAITIRDLDDQITYWNRSAERIYGWSSAEAVGQIAHQLLRVDPGKFSQARQELLARNFWMGEYLVHGKSGQEVLIESTWTLVRDSQGQPKSILTLSVDITCRRRLEQQVTRSQRIESLGTLASGVAHDLNNILTPIMVSIGLLKEQTTDPAFEQLITSLEAGTRRGARLVKQILTFGRGVQGERIPLSLVGVAREIQQFAQETFPKSIQFEFLTPDHLWSVVGDHTQIHQVLLNLAINARDAMPGGGKLTFAFENHVIDSAPSGLNPEFRAGPHVLIQVTDTGMGMSKEIIERIFDPFFTTKPANQGTGLGLSTSLGIIKSHGGGINVYSEPGQGSTFKIYLPASTTGEQSEQPAVNQSGLPMGHNELILLVDDEEAICTSLKKILERSGYRVKTAAHGAEAISIYATHGPEIALVITDMHMPIMDGPATIVALQSMNPKVKIIGSSGLASNGGVAKAASAGVRHFVPKPYTAEKMLHTLRAALDGGPTNDSGSGI